MTALHPFPNGRGRHWSARLGHVADAIARETGMALPLPGSTVPAVSAAVPPRPDGGTPPQVPARAMAALTFVFDQAVFRVATEQGDVLLRFSRETHRISVVGTRKP